MPLLTLFNTIISSIVGIMGIFGGIMKAVESYFEKRKQKKEKLAKKARRRNIRERMINLFPTLPHRNKKPLYNPKDLNESSKIENSSIESNGDEEEAHSLVEEEDGEYEMGPTDYRFSDES